MNSSSQHFCLDYSIASSAEGRKKLLKCRSRVTNEQYICPINKLSTNEGTFSLYKRVMGGSVGRSSSSLEVKFPFVRKKLVHRYDCYLVHNFTRLLTSLNLPREKFNVNVKDIVLGYSILLVETFPSINIECKIVHPILHSSRLLSLVINLDWTLKGKVR